MSKHNERKKAATGQCPHLFGDVPSSRCHFLPGIHNKIFKIISGEEANIYKGGDTLKVYLDKRFNST